MELLPISKRLHGLIPRAICGLNKLPAICILLVWLHSSSAFAGNLDLHYGVNHIDINADGVMDVILKVRWENGNAHSFDKYMVALSYGNVFLEVPLGDSAKYEFRNEEGADCIVEDYSFRKDDKGWLVVTEYRREFGKSYMDFQKVEITTYKLVEETDPIPGFPLYFLKPALKQVTKKKYCDVRELMK